MPTASVVIMSRATALLFISIFIANICLSSAFSSTLPVRTFFRTSTENSIPITVAPSRMVAKEELGEDEDVTERAKREAKLSLLSLAASYDRGYGATPDARKRAKELVDVLKGTTLDNSDDPARGADGAFSPADGSSPPLRGIWRMVWTTAADVLVLNVNPLFSVGAIYQDASDLPVIVNIIDFIPRYQNLLPLNLGLPESRIRAEVQTRGGRRPEVGRVGLSFEAVKVRPLEILGVDAASWPTTAGFDLPKLPGIADPSSGPGYFDILYLDDDMLIISQNEPGGIFVSVRVPYAD
eukprot:CAMPEP_0113300120 /NCGR_PEP_ID=MMETSP0010_2-20120614/1878_1 /TAXON_ID=216773 ORGANISM="Corethron hystrix, Strain 308" /NCGR_SAMPLE_ID=MMETSP0010_2 /ASSEMBLY_ACC=CAM_ASM_000155 /LENGTH=295 /DNA_ID=CAMNT_0000153483 /DNA_START=122 /DNA_END=1009 /DNA_ORIENTATION=+ /assembly_acc=CAM_ASM_000155